MARWDVYVNAARRGSSDTPYLLDVQADLLGELRTRVVVPLRRSDAVPRPITRLQPRLRIGDTDVVMDTPMIVGAPITALGPRVQSVESHAAVLLGAIDLLLTGA